MKKFLISLGFLPLFLFVALCLMAIIVPPFQKADEPVHFYRAMTVASGQFLCKTSEAGRKEFVLPKRVYEFPAMLSTGDVIMKQDNKFAIGLLRKSFPYKATEYGVTHEFNYCELPAIAYVPQAAAVLLLAPFDNLLITFYGMRIMSLLMFFFCFIISFRMIPKKYQSILVLFSFIPMVLHQVTAVSYDAVSISLSMIAGAAFIGLLCSKRKTWGQWIVFIILLLGMNLVKGGYYGLLVLPLFVIPAKMPFKKIIIAAVIAFVIGIFIINAAVPLRSFFSSLDIQQWLIFANPVHSFSVVFATVVEDNASLLKGTLGMFGWLDYELPFSFYLLIGSVIGIVVYTVGREEDKPISIGSLLLLTAVLFSNIILIFYHFYVYVTPIGYYKIVGLQGRYFLPLLFLFLFCITQWVSYGKRFQQLASLFFGTITIIVIFCAVYNRYYNYQTFYANPDAIETDLKEGVIQPKYLTSFLIDKSMNFIFPIEKGKKIGGFQLLLENQKTTNVLYTYALKDGDCQKTIRSGYFDHVIGELLAHLKQDGELPYTQPIPITLVESDTVCLSLDPIRIGQKPVYLSALGEQESPVIRFLYIRQ